MLLVPCTLCAAAICEEQEAAQTAELAVVAPLGQSSTTDGSSAETGGCVYLEDDSWAAQKSNSNPAMDLYATTPLLRSLAASAAPAVEPTQGQLAVDDFYVRPLLKRAVSYRDTYEPFDKDYTDVQIRCVFPFT